MYLKINIQVNWNKKYPTQMAHSFHVNLALNLSHSGKTSHPMRCLTHINSSPSTPSPLPSYLEKSVNYDFTSVYNYHVKAIEN